MYKVIHRFKDNDGRVYDIGDYYPNISAKKPTNARIKALSTENNKYKKVYIKKVVE